MLSPAGLGQTIAVVDQSGKVVSTSKHLLNVFKEAKFAYRERKAEIVALKKLKAEKERALQPGRAYTIQDDDRTSISSRRHSHSHRGGDEHRHRHRRHSGSKAGSVYPASDGGFERDIGSPRSPRSPRPDLSRRHTTRDGAELAPISPKSPTRSISADAIDMNLAYGDLPPDLGTSQEEDEQELKGLVGKVKGLLDEADCVQHTVTATITNLQKNPEAMAAVALTLAEISNLVKKMAPGALMSVRAAAPAVFALLASPQFLIAAGVGVGITIVAFGGYKIIKKIQERNKQDQMEEMLEIGQDVSRIESWRQGIAEVEASAVGTSVDGELITPLAHNMSRLNLEEERREKKSKPRAGAAKTTVTKGSKTSKTSKSGSEKGGKSKKEAPKKKPSPLRLMFTP